MAGSGGETIHEIVLYFVRGGDHASMETSVETVGGSANRPVEITGLGLLPGHAKAGGRTGKLCYRPTR